MKEKEFNFNKELEKWFNKWHRKPVTGRCLIELKQRDKEFIKRLKEEVLRYSWENYDMINRTSKHFIEEIDKLAGDKLVE